MKTRVHRLLRRRGISAVIVSVVVLSICTPATAADTIPVAAKRYQRTLIRSAHAHWGLDAPVATFAAQIHQESRWLSTAVSPAGAQGLAQFMPGTSAWMSEIYPNTLRQNQPMNPGWAIRALVIYDRWIYNRVRAHAADECNAIAMMLAGYNGGLGWVIRDQRLALAKGADPAKWFDSVEHYTARADWARHENRQYVRLILLRWVELYKTAGWGSGSC